MSDEIGRELRASDLKPRTIVVVKPPDPQERNAHMTFWVRAVEPAYVVFYSAVLHWAVINFRGPDDTVVDDQGRQVHVFEYLGEP